MRSASIVLGLALGCIVAGAAGYIDSSTIKSAPAITFLWCVLFDFFKTSVALMLISNIRRQGFTLLNCVSMPQGFSRLLQSTVC